MKIIYNKIILISTILFISHSSINIYCMKKPNEEFPIKMVTANPANSKELQEMMDTFDQIEFDEYLEPGPTTKEKLLKKQLDLINNILKKMLEEINFKNFYDVTPEEYVHIGKKVSERLEELLSREEKDANIQMYINLSQQITKKRHNEIKKIKNIINKINKEIQKINTSIAKLKKLNLNKLDNQSKLNIDSMIKQQENRLTELKKQGKESYLLIKVFRDQQVNNTIRQRDKLSQTHLKSKIQKLKIKKLNEPSWQNSFWRALRRIRR